MNTQDPMPVNEEQDSSVQAVLLSQAKTFNQWAEEILRDIQATVSEAESTDEREQNRLNTEIAKELDRLEKNEVISMNE
jgi:hypothetical protein